MLLEAYFAAAALVVVYAGAVALLFLFVVEANRIGDGSLHAIYRDITKRIVLRISAGDDRIKHRIVAVADVFDALTSRRSYKEAWSNDDAFTLLRKLGGESLDRDCVEALINNRKVVEEIQQPIF